MNLPSENAQRLLRAAAGLGEDLAQIEEVIGKCRKGLAHIKDRKPHWMEIDSFGKILHDFYNCVENALYRVGMEVNGGPPAGPDWHRSLIETMRLEIPELRPAFLSRKTAERLEEYLKFRHRFRHRYMEPLTWTRLKPLIEGVESTFELFRDDTVRFQEFLRATARRIG